MLVLIVLTYGYSFIEKNPWVIAAMSGIRAAICPIIISAVMGMVKGAFAVRPCYLITLAAAAIYIFTDLSCVYIILFGALCGLLITEIMERRGMLR